MGKNVKVEVDYLLEDLKTKKADIAAVRDRLRELRKALTDAGGRAAATRRAARVGAFRDRIRADARGRRTDVYRYLRNKPFSSIDMVERKDVTRRTRVTVNRRNYGGTVHDCSTLDPKDLGKAFTVEVVNVKDWTHVKSALN